jgi:hypothetical protein
MVTYGVGRIGGAAAPRRAVRAAGGFGLPGTGSAAAAATSSAGDVAALLALQEGERTRDLEPPAERARRRARAALDELRGLQLELLRGGADPARLERLAELAEAEETLADPALREVVAGVALRVRVELARRRARLASAA